MAFTFDEGKLHSWQRYGEASDEGHSGGGDKGGDQNLPNSLDGGADSRILCLPLNIIRYI